MLSKREKFYRAAERLGGLRCPRCGGALARAGEDFLCAAGHRVNMGRKGCLNFLSAPVGGCYDAALFAARRRVFAAGCYDEVARALGELLPPGEHRLLDAGCGDGWYLNALLAAHPAWCGAGVDISRDAVAQATDQPCEAVWCVADLRRLPFSDGAFTAVLDVLTPASYEEFGRVLASGGVLVKVYPGEGYLREIRRARGMAAYAEGQVEAYLREKTRLLARRRVVKACPVDAALWGDFVWMTPLNQDLSPKEKEALASRPADTVTVDLHVAMVSLEGQGKGRRG